MNSNFITEETMGQFMEVKRTGECNIFDYNCVIRVARRLKLKDLISLSIEQYGKLLINAGVREVWSTRMLIKRKGKDLRLKALWM